MRVPSVARLKEIATCRHFRGKQAADIYASPAHERQNLVSHARPYVVLRRQLVGKRRKWQRRKEFAEKDVLVEAYGEGQWREIAVLGLEQFGAVDQCAEKIPPRVEIDTSHRAPARPPFRPPAGGSKKRQLHSYMRSNHQRRPSRGLGKSPYHRGPQVGVGFRRHESQSVLSSRKFDGVLRSMHCAGRWSWHSTSLLSLGKYLRQLECGQPSGAMTCHIIDTNLARDSVQYLFSD